MAGERATHPRHRRRQAGPGRRDHDVGGPRPRYPRAGQWRVHRQPIAGLHVLDPGQDVAERVDGRGQQRPVPLDRVRGQWVGDGHHVVAGDPAVVQRLPRLLVGVPGVHHGVAQQDAFTGVRHPVEYRVVALPQPVVGGEQAGELRVQVPRVLLVGRRRRDDRVDLADQRAQPVHQLVAASASPAGSVSPTAATTSTCSW